ncbi:hypothetical protein AR685_03220 [Chryseobacterium sp. JAH]|nr:hypothetical protein AR685_03220 [Chryseobacterium sp. JAH]
MRKLFTKYFFAVFLIPILVLAFFYFFGTKVEGETYSVNRRISFGIDIDGILRNPVYNILIFYGTYPVYLLCYFIVFLLRRHTNFILSIMNFMIVTMNFYLICENPENRILIPLTMFGFIFFIFNIFKTTKKLTTINQQQSTI